MEYPTRRGIAIPSSELGLPETRLDLDRPHTTNNHHMAWTRRKCGEFLITQTLRDLEGLQEQLPIDVHAYLHKIYDPPKFPTVEEAMTRVMQAYDNDEMLQVKADKGYELRPITDDLIGLLSKEYTELR